MSEGFSYQQRARVEMLCRKSLHVICKTVLQVSSCVPVQVPEHEKRQI